MWKLEVPEQIYIRSKRDSEGEEVKLPTIDMSTNPFDVQGVDDTTIDLSTKPITDTLAEGETPKGTHNCEAEPLVETVGENEDDTSPMDDPPLKDQPPVETADDDEFVADHIRDPQRQPDDTVEFVLDLLRTENPTTPGLPLTRWATGPFLCHRKRMARA